MMIIYSSQLNVTFKSFGICDRLSEKAKNTSRSILSLYLISFVYITIVYRDASGRQIGHFGERSEPYKVHIYEISGFQIYFLQKIILGFPFILKFLVSILCFWNFPPPLNDDIISKNIG